MKIVVFGPQERLGVWEGDAIIDLNAADAKLPATLAPFIELGASGIQSAKLVVERLRGSAANGSTVFNAADVELHAPWARKRVACCGGNYAAHSYGMSINSGQTDVTMEKVFARSRANGNWGFWKVLDAVAGTGDEIPYPKRVDYFDYEGEVAIVIGKRGKDIAASRIGEYVWGVTLANDWSSRDAGGQPRGMSFNLAKNFDFSLSLGPCIVVDELDPQNVSLETRVNGKMRQQFNTADMVFSFAETLEYLSRDFTFIPGDIILGGTGAGTAQDSTKAQADGSRAKDLFLKQGDLVELSSPSIGKLTNRIV